MPILMGTFLLTGSFTVWASDYFDPRLLALGGSQTTSTDLSIFESAGQVAEGVYLVTLWMNQSEKGLYKLVFKRNEQGKVLPQLTPTFLYELGVNTTALPNFNILPLDVPVNDLATLIPDSYVNFNLSQLRVDISVPQIAMQQNATGYVDSALWDDGVPAFFMNYRLNGSQNWQDAQVGMDSSEQTNVFASLQSGFNWEAWRLRSDITFNHNQISGEISSSDQSTNFSNTYLQRDIHTLRAEFLAGENNTGNEVFDSIPFRGVKFNSSEEMLPNSQRGFAPEISGIAQSNARVTVSQNGNVVYQTYVAPGAFRITDLYQTGQGGDLTVTITEADGSVRIQKIAISSLPVMQRPGTLKYELTTGHYNGGITTTSRESSFGMGTFIYGLPYDMTLYGGALIADDYYSLVGGAGLSLGDFGALSLDITTSNTKLYGQDEWQQGSSYRMRYAKSLLSTGTSIDLTAYRYSTRDYYSFSDFNNFGFQLNDDQMPWALERQRSNFQMRVSQQLGHWGSLYLSASRNDFWNNGQVNNTVSAGYNTSYRGVSYGLAYSIDRIKGDGNWPENHQLSLNVQVPFSLFSSSPRVSRNYANYQMTHDNRGQVHQQAGISGNALEDRLSYSAMQDWSNDSHSNNSTLNAGYQGTKGMANIGYSYSNEFRSLNLSGSGSMVVHPEGVTLGQMLGNSVAIVKAPGAVGAALMNGNMRFDESGYALVPYLSNYQNNSISLNPATLPDDVDITQSTLNVYPTKGAVVMAKFDTRVGYQALVTLYHNDAVLPFGTMVTVEGSTADQSNVSIVGDAGQVYLSGLPEKGQVTAKWGLGADQQCHALFDFTSVTTTSGSGPLRQLTAHCEAG